MSHGPGQARRSGGGTIFRQTLPITIALTVTPEVRRVDIGSELNQRTALALTPGVSTTLPAMFGSGPRTATIKVTARRQQMAQPGYEPIVPAAFFAADPGIVSHGS